MHRHPVLRLSACSTHRTVLAAALAGIIVSTTAAAADKTDIMLFKNGDRLTGEVKSLDRGKVSFDTDAMGVIKVEWDDIARCTRPRPSSRSRMASACHGSLAETSSRRDTAAGMHPRSTC
jgi:hypothetical protein